MMVQKLTGLRFSPKENEGAANFFREENEGAKTFSGLKISHLPLYRPINFEPSLNRWRLNGHKQNIPAK